MNAAVQHIEISPWKHAPEQAEAVLENVMAEIKWRQQVLASGGDADWPTVEVTILEIEEVLHYERVLALTTDVARFGRKSDVRLHLVTRTPLRKVTSEQLSPYLRDMATSCSHVTLADADGQTYEQLRDQTMAGAATPPWS